MKKTKIIISGHICVDFTPPFDTDENYSKIDEVLLPGKLIHVGAANFYPGGVVVNSGLAMKFLGADVLLMGKIGQDAFGKMILDILKNYDAHEGIIIDSKSSTSYTVVLAVPGIDRIFFHNPGANDTFSSNDIDYSKCENAVLFHFGYPPLMKNMYINNGIELTKIFQRVKEKNCITSLDMAAIDENSEAGQANWYALLKNTLPYVDFFMPSIEEICFMLDREKYHELQQRASGGDVTRILSIKNDVAPMADELLKMGCKIAIIKCGAAGFYYRTADKNSFKELEKISNIDFSSFASQEGFEKSFVPDAIISGTGAGDTTIAAFLTAIVKGCEFKKCLAYASGTGACCMSSVNALDALKSFDELEAKINNGWKKQNLLSDEQYYL